MMKKSILLTLQLLLIFGFGLIGCTDSPFIDNNNIDKEVNSDEWQPIELSFEASEQSVPKVRAALNPEDENAINQVRVLVFDNTGTFDYEAKVTSVTPNPNPNPDNKTGKVQLLAKNISQGKVVMLSNVAATPNEATIKALTDKSLSNVLKQFEFGMPTANSWTAGTFPMWGQLENITINHSSPNPVIGGSGTTFHLIRAVARIDVGLNVSGTQFKETAAGITGINLTAVHFFNMNNKGCVAPATTNYSTTDNKVTAPTIPGSAPALSTVDFNKNDEIQNGNLLQRLVYVPEAINENTTTTDYMTRPYMVVGLTKDGTQTFYRIDFLKKNGEEATAIYEYLPLLRNHRYLINIANVGGPGFTDIEDAKKGPAANIMYNVEVWNESEVSNVVYDGQYMLAVSEDNLTYYNHAHAKEIIVRTTWPEGWKATVTEGADWITINPTEGAVNKDVTLSISVGDNSADDAVERNGVVTITAGRMTWKVNVKQLTEGEISLEIYEYEADGTTLNPTPITMLNFTGVGGTKKIAVKYAPSNAPDMPVGNPNAEGYSGPIDLTLQDFVFQKQPESVNGMAVYNVKVGAMSKADNYFESITEVVNFTINSDGKTVSKALVLQQTEYNAIPYEALDFSQLIQFVETPDGGTAITHNGSIPFFLMDGQPGDNFVIKANTRYEIKMKSATNKPQVNTNNNQGLKLIEGGFPLNDEVVEKRGKFAGETLGFTTANDLQAPKRFLGHVEFEITSPDDLFEPRTFKLLIASGIMQPEANTYLMKPGNIGIIIPVSQIDKAAEYYNNLQSSFQPYISQLNKSLGGRTWDANFKLPTLDKTRPWTVEVLWAEVMNTYPNNEPVVSMTDPNKGVLYILTEAGKDYIFVMPSYKHTGNVIIGLKQDNKIMWSWHLWLVDTYPSDDPVYPAWEQGITPHPDENGIRWLDRDLGAFGVTTKENGEFDNYKYEQHGLLYQWGRKDPFPLLMVKNKSVFEGTGRGKRNTKLIDAQGNNYYNDFIGASHVKPVGTMKEMINNPTVYYSTTKPTNGVHYEEISPFLELPNGSPTFIANPAYAALWGGSFLNRPDIKFDANIAPTKKTPFDPSPYGWKVPNSGAEANWGAYRARLSTVKGTSDFYKQEPGNYFPNMSSGDSESFRWTSTRIINDVRGRAIWGTGKGPNPANNIAWSTSAGIMVRSVQDETKTDYDQYLPKIIVKP